MPGQKPTEYKMIITKATILNGKRVAPGDSVTANSKYLVQIKKAVLESSVSDIPALKKKLKAEHAKELKPDSKKEG